MDLMAISLQHTYIKLEKTLVHVFHKPKRVKIKINNRFKRGWVSQRNRAFTDLSSSNVPLPPASGSSEPQLPQHRSGLIKHCPAGLGSSRTLGRGCFTTGSKTKTHDVQAWNEWYDNGTSLVSPWLFCAYSKGYQRTIYQQHQHTSTSSTPPPRCVKELERLPESTVTPMVANWKRQYLISVTWTPTRKTPRINLLISQWTTPSSSCTWNLHTFSGPRRLLMVRICSAL